MVCCFDIWSFLLVKKDRNTKAFPIIYVSSKTTLTVQNEVGGGGMSHTYWHVEVISVSVDAMSRYHMKMRFLFCLAMPRIRYYYCGKF